MPTNVKGRESTENVPAARRVRDVSNVIQYLDPNENPFTLLTKKAQKRKVVNSKFEFIEKELMTKVDQVNGAQTNVDTSIEVDAGNLYFAHDLVLNVRTMEIFRVVSIAANTLTVVRGVGSVAGTAMNDNDDVIIVGNANEEGGALGIERSVQESFPYNLTQIFRFPFGTTGTEEASENYGGRDRPRLFKEAGVQHAIDIEYAFIYGQRNIDTTDTNKPRRYTGGFLYFVTTNVTDVGGTITEPSLETILGTIFEATSSGPSRVLFASTRLISTIDQLAAGRLQVVPSDKTYGIAVNQWLTSHGTLQIVKHRLLKNGPGGTGFAGYGLLADPRKLTYAYLRGRDTKHREDIGTPGDDGWTDELLTECGFEVALQKAHGVIKGVV
jgi:hypothetical protein